MNRNLAVALVLSVSVTAFCFAVASPARAQEDPSALPSYAQPAPGAVPQAPPPQPAPQEMQPGPQDVQQPAAGPAVARLSALEGSVVLKHGDAGDQATAEVNAPIVAGDYLTTGGDGRAEVQLDENTLVRAGAQTQLRFPHLDGQNDVAQIAQGTLELRVFAQDPDNVQVETPSVDVEPSQPGAYLITVGSDGNTQITARSGSLAVVTPQGSEEVQPGQTMVVTGPASDPQYQYIAEVPQSDLEAWGDQRDQAMTVAVNAQVNDVPDDMTGASDLDQYGNWVDVPGYGDSWVPDDQGPDWTPYSDGSWVTMNYYGPTWVSAEPWGWAPYHYGRWFTAPGYGWCWYPGPRYVHPVWSPALVAFFGFGGVGIGFGNVGWVPLAPGEFFRPWWGPGASLSFGVAVGDYRNYAHGFISVPYATFRGGRPIRNVRPMSVAALRGMTFYRGSVPVARMSGFGGANRMQGAAGWQHFSGAHASTYGAFRTNYAPRSYQNYDQTRRSYSNYQTQRSYPNYQARRSYQNYGTQRSYSNYQTQRSYPNYQSRYQYRSYRYAPQRQYAAPRSYQTQGRSMQYRSSSGYARGSAPSRGGGRGNSHGPGRP